MANNNDTALVKLDNATKMLAEAKTLDEVKHIVDIAEAARVYARAAKLGLEAYNHAAAVKVRAERKAGEMLKEMELNKGGRPPETSDILSPVNDIPKLSDLEISKKQSSRWQTLTEMPEDDFEAHIQEVIKERPITTSSIVTEIKKSKIKKDLDDVKSKEIKKTKGIFDVIVIDPPWPIQKIEREVAENQALLDYPIISLGEIKEIKIPAADDCHLWLWTTHKFLPTAFDILDYWNAKYVCTFVWHKKGGFQPFGLPQYNCEFALYARIGSPTFIDLKNFKLCFEAPRGSHSEKPEVFYEMIRQKTAGRRLDMFNRREIKGFETEGNEAK